MMNFRKVWNEYHGLFALIAGILFFFGVMIYMVSNDRACKLAEADCKFYGYPDAGVTWDLEPICVAKDRTRISARDAWKQHRLDRDVEVFIQQLFGPIEYAFALEVINCVPSRFNQDGTPLQVSCKEKVWNQEFCDEVDSEHVAGSRQFAYRAPSHERDSEYSFQITNDFSCREYDKAKAYALSGGMKISAANGKTVNPTSSEFHEDCLILELDSTGIPLRRMCKLVTNKREGSVTSCSIRLEEDFRVNAAYETSCDDFDKAWMKRHPSK